MSLFAFVAALLFGHGRSSPAVGYSGTSTADDGTKSNSGMYTIDMHGGIDQGEYYIFVQVGTPPMVFRVQVDTGSALLFVPGVECSECTLHTDNLYDALKSSTAETVGCGSQYCDKGTCSSCDVCNDERNACCAASHPDECGFSVRYGGGTSASGPLTRDVVRIGPLEHKLTFGRVTRETGEWLSTVDGIMGMAFKALDCSPTCVEPVFESMVASGVVEDIFSICMGNEQGKLTFGGHDTAFYSAPLVYTDIVPQYGNLYTFYTVSFLDLKIDGKSVLTSFEMGDTAVVDSGSTMLLLRNDLYAQLVDRFKTHYCHLQAVCSSPSVLDPPVDGVQSCLEDPPYGEWPVLEIVLDNVHLYMPVELYFVKSNGKYCFAVQPTPATAGSMNILGDAFLRGFYVVYDRTNKRVGFAASNPDTCGYPGGGSVNQAPREGLTKIQIVITTVGCVIVCPLLLVLLAIYRDPVRDQIDQAQMYAPVEANRSNGKKHDGDDDNDESQRTQPEHKTSYHQHHQSAVFTSHELDLGQGVHPDARPPTTSWNFPDPLRSRLDL